MDGVVQTVANSGIVRIPDPFPHFTTRSVLNPVFADDLYNWLCMTDTWRLAEKQLYRQYEIEFSHQPPSGAGAALTRPYVVKQILNLCEHGFGVELFPAVTISARKITSGQFIDIHTDFSKGDPLPHTHRLTFYIGRGDTVIGGGDLLLFSDSTATEPARRYVPTCNSGFGFECAANSFHAVAPVDSGERYSIVISMRARREQTDAQILAALPESFVKRLFTASG